MTELNTNNLIFPTGISAKRLKSEAKKLKKTTGLSHTQALTKVAKENGPYRNWDDAIRQLTKQRLAATRG
ncbi:hypothetical protein COB52_00045 [Candidatus Kaiserbacteria bacterium]|nr:MAG: hypothetical protein COB52_00045 [Candidatus Kaiserbacteria bacterium]